MINWLSSQISLWRVPSSSLQTPDDVPCVSIRLLRFQTYRDSRLTLETIKVIVTWRPFQFVSLLPNYYMLVSYICLIISLGQWFSVLATHIDRLGDFRTPDAWAIPPTNYIRISGGVTQSSVFCKVPQKTLRTTVFRFNTLTYVLQTFLNLWFLKLMF